MTSAIGREEASNPSLSDLLVLLSSKSKVCRDRALSDIRALIPDLDLKQISVLSSNLIDICSSSCWESREAAVSLLTALVEHRNAELSSSDALVLLLLGDEELRVRSAAVELIERLAEQDAEHVSACLLPVLTAYAVDEMGRTACLPDSGAVVPVTGEAALGGGSGVTGNLEISILAISAVLRGSRKGGLKNVILPPEIVSRGLAHNNRFVREQSLILASELVKSCPVDFVQLGEWISRGLGDPWTQVRYAAGVLCRISIIEVEALSSSSDFLSLVVPHLLLNRHFGAEGLRGHCQETWRLLVKDQGIALIRKELSNVYGLIANAGVSGKEASLFLLAEMAQKVLPGIIMESEFGGFPISHFLRVSLEAIIDGLEDDSWPVRSVSIQAIVPVFSCIELSQLSSVLLPCFYDKIRDQLLDSLSDSITGLRKDAAETIEALSRQSDEHPFIFNDVWCEQVILTLIGKLFDSGHHSEEKKTAMFSCCSFGSSNKRSKGHSTAVVGGGQIAGNGSSIDMVDGGILLLAELSDKVNLNAKVRIHSKCCTSEGHSDATPLVHEGMTLSSTLLHILNSRDTSREMVNLQASLCQVIPKILNGIKNNDFIDALDRLKDSCRHQRVLHMRCIEALEKLSSY